MPFPLDTQRHSASHLLAAAIRELFPEAKFAGGPAIDNGFYYDVDLSRTLTPDDLKTIQKKMEHLQKQNASFERFSMPIDEAITRLQAENQPYKVEFAEDLKKSGETELSFYRSGNFVDMCAGPHVEKMSQIGAFTLDRIAGAYFRGDAKRPMLQRVYGLCFKTPEDLKRYEEAMAEAKKRDHRTLGAALELFTIVDEVGSGLPIYLPRGAKLRQLLERYMLAEAEKAGYQYIYTPHIAKSDLFARSGHLAHYRDGMFSPIRMTNLNGEGSVDGKVDEFYLKPMNCPMHHQVYLHRPRSYRDLPMRLTEFGTVYRYEESGVLSGLIRVRGFTQNDAHVYCMRNQLFEVISEALSRFIRTYEALGIRDYTLRFSLPDFENNAEKYGEKTQEWHDAIVAMRETLDKMGISYYDAPNEAAFYGPKIDIQVKNVNGKEDTLSTIQVDFSIAQKFGIVYTNAEGKEETPAIIHMALMGSVERFMAFLIEMNAGRFPFWIAPEQVRVVSVAQSAVPYAREVSATLAEVVLMKPLKFNEIRVTVDASDDSLGKKIRRAETDKIPAIVVVGDRDAESNTVSLRTREGERIIPLAELSEALLSL